MWVFYTQYYDRVRQQHVNIIIMGCIVGCLLPFMYSRSTVCKLANINSYKIGIYVSVSFNFQHWHKYIGINNIIDNKRTIIIINKADISHKSSFVNDSDQIFHF